jgi:hypothetical protein
MNEFFKGGTLRTCMPSWALLGDHLITIWSSRLGLLPKVKLTGAVVRAGRWYQQFLREELQTVVRILFARRRRRTAPSERVSAR